MRKLILLPLILFLLIIADWIANLAAEYLWYRDVGYEQMLIKPLLTKMVIGGVYALFLFFFIFSAFLVVRKAILVYAEEKGYPEEQLARIQAALSSRWLKGLLFLVAGVISFAGGAAFAQASWLPLLAYFNQTPFPWQDPIFGYNVAYYVFSLPLFLMVLDALRLPLVAIFLLCFGFYALTGFVRIKNWKVWRAGSLEVQHSALRHLGVLLAFIFVFSAAGDYFKIPGTLFSRFGYVFGAGYTDLHIMVPLYRLMIGLNLLSAGLIVVATVFRRTRLMFLPFLFVVGVAVAGNLWAQIYQSFVVSNNEFTREEPYIRHEMKYTRLAFGLDGVKTIEYPGNAEIGAENIRANMATIENVRLNDPKPLLQTLSQKQGIRQYYRFHDIDVDRYLIDGRLREVFLAARELSVNDIDEKAKTFINTRLKYTHGFGAVAVLANDVDSSGFPNLLVRDIPPVAVKKELTIKEPRIYFGEITDDGYVIVNTKTKEFDYPMGDNNAETVYRGKGGIPLTGWKKLLLSWQQKTLRFYLTREVSAESRLLLHRNIRERVERIAPFLTYDSDPYLVIGEDGRLYWIIDAYTTTDKFPYSNPVGDINYIRNPIKVVVDAYHGQVDFYLLDPSEPLAATYNRIFPGLFKDGKKMPAFLRKHIRYPEDMFRLQTEVLRAFHISNPGVFYNKEDVWDIAKKDGENYIEPYYAIMRLKGENKEEFILMRPFTPASRGDNKRNNIVAWLAARNDAPHYGELVLYKLPKGVEVDGPLNILSRINQDPVISSQLTLWDQKGSSVYHGNLFAIPIDGAFLYVQPIYIKAESSPLPQMQRVIVAYNDKLAMEPTLEKAINRIFGPVFAEEENAGTGNGEKTGASPGKQDNLYRSLLEDISKMRAQLDALEAKLKEMEARSGQQAGTH